MILHIKPTCGKEALFRFKSNYIRLYRTFDDFKGSVYTAITEGVETHGNGIGETSQNINNEVQNIMEKYRKLCTQEIKKVLRDCARELDIPL